MTIPIGAYGYTVFVSSAGVIGKLPQIITDMNNQGTTVLRLQIPWYLIDTVQDGTQNTTTYTWSGLDDAVTKCNAANIFLIFSIMYAPTGTTGQSPNSLFPITASTGYYTYALTSSGTTQYVPDPTKLATFATQVATRYNGGAHGTIQCVEPGNEEYCLAANTNGVRDLGGTPAALALASCYANIKSANANCYVSAAALLRQDTTGITTWLTLFNTSSGFSYCDSVQYHLYKNSGSPPAGNGGPELGTVGFSLFWQTMKSVMTSLGVSKPIWVTEAGYGTDLVDVNYQWLYCVQELDSCANSNGVVTMYLHYTIGNNDPKSQTQHGQVDSIAETWQPIFGVFGYYARLNPNLQPLKKATHPANIAEIK